MNISTTFFLVRARKNTTSWNNNTGDGNSSEENAGKNTHIHTILLSAPKMSTQKNEIL